MNIRLAKLSDLPRLLEISNGAIQVLKEQGSPQWQNGYGPTEEKLRADINHGWLYVLEEEQVLAFAALVPGVDEVYTNIREGQWQGDAEYLSVHRFAVSRDVSGQGLAKKLLKAMVDQAARQHITDIRIDTHKLNIGMQKAILANGFTYRGQVTFPIPEGDRKAYQIVITNEFV